VVVVDLHILLDCEADTIDVERFGAVDILDRHGHHLKTKEQVRLLHARALGCAAALSANATASAGGRRFLTPVPAAPVAEADGNQARLERSSRRAIQMCPVSTPAAPLSRPGRPGARPSGMRVVRAS
jgi:hypothetical protein